MDPSPHEPSAASDIELMTCVGNGDESAFRTLLERHTDRVRGTIYKMLPYGSETDDLAQEVFLRVWKAAPRYQPSAKFTTWLMTITRNVVFNESRKKGRAAFVPVDSDQPSAEVRNLSQPIRERPDRVLQSEDVQKAVDLALRELPEKQRLAIVLHRYEGMPHEEVAKVLGTSVPSVKSLIFRGRESLRISLSWLLESE